MGLCALALRAVVKVVVKGWLRLCMIFEIGERKHVICFFTVCNVGPNSQLI